MSSIGDRQFVARAGWALALAHARYWSSVAPLVRGQLRRWETRAAEIPDRRLKDLACGKLVNERFNVEVAAMVATIAPSRHRGRTVEAVVALQVMFDYLDALTEQPAADPIRDGLQLSKAFTDAVTVSAEPAGDYYAHCRGAGDAGYLADLALAVRGALMCLPAIDAVAEVIPTIASRCAEAQVRAHASPLLGIAQLERWATHGAAGTELQWREFLFGAMGSVLAANALIAAAADERTTREQASELDSTYLSLCVLTTALDHLVDYEHDALTGEQSYLYLYESHAVLAQQITTITGQVIERTRTIPNGPHHAAILAGVVAYYTSQSSAMGQSARPVTEQVRDQLRPLITPTLASLHAWRLAKRLRILSLHDIRPLPTLASCATRLVRARDGCACRRGSVVLEGELGLEGEATMRADRGQDKPARGVGDAPPVH
jgi:tetraprenyl-beta-curcumene synthase